MSDEENGISNGNHGSGFIIGNGSLGAVSCGQVENY